MTKLKLTLLTAAATLSLASPAWAQISQNKMNTVCKDNYCVYDSAGHTLGQVQQQGIVEIVAQEVPSARPQFAGAIAEQIGKKVGPLVQERGFGFVDLAWCRALVLFGIWNRHNLLLYHRPLVRESLKLVG